MDEELNDTPETLTPKEPTQSELMYDRFLKTGDVFASNDTTMDDLFREQGFGSQKSRLTAALYGFDHESIGTHLDYPKEEYGMVFFTKPRLNLSYNNIKHDRVFAPMQSRSGLSIPRIVKAYLDPVEAIIGKRGSPLVDNNSPFITLLTQSCTQLSGWPDLYAKTYSSKPGLYGQTWAKPDGPAKFYEAFPISGTFNPGISDIVGDLFHKWVTYSLLVHDGTFSPYLDYIISNRMDFNTRIYVVVLDSTRTRVKKISCCGAAFPQFTNTGLDANYNREAPSIEAQPIQMQFTAMGVFYRDGIVAHAFNRTVQDWMPAMHDKYRNSYMVKLRAPYKRMMNNLGYPRINPLNSDWEWWVKKEDYDMIIKRGG